MKTSIYRNLQRKIVVITLLVSLSPLLILGATIYFQFANMYREKIEEQVKYRANSKAEAVDLFLKERTAILAAMVDTHSFNYMSQEENLSRVLSVVNFRAGAFVDLGVIDSAGQHLAYVGPYDLKGLNYYSQPWFDEVMRKGIYISDVYLGYRQLPHFIIAVLRHEKGESWILRATIDPDIFGRIVRGAQLGKSGDAYIISKQGVFQTASRFNGSVLSKCDLNTTLFDRATTIVEFRNDKGKRVVCAGNWLKKDNWLLVISQDVNEEMQGFFAAQHFGIIIMVAGILGIILTVFFTTRMTVSRLRESDNRYNELNAQLVQSDKLAALGKMAAGVAHEINNPLAVILQKTGWMEDLIDEEEIRNSKSFEELRASIRVIEDHVERARKVVHNMLGYARKMEPRLEDVDVNETLKQTIVLLNNYARINSITIATDFQEKIPITAGDQAMLQQVFFNLITNAIDAIGNNGHIKVVSRQSESFIEVDIIDDGPGIAVEQQKKVFDPFYTTKATGKGTGLGLWVSYNIMNKMGGAISLISNVGEGSKFTVKIPVIAPEKK